MDHDHHKGCNCAITATATQTLDELEFERGVWAAAMRGDTDKLYKLLVEKEHSPNKRDASGYTALHYAARAGKVEAARMLVEHKADVNAQTRGTKATPLHRAAYMGHEDFCKLLLDTGADPMLADFQGSTALHKAAQRGQRKVIPLIRGCSSVLLSCKDNKGQTPMDIAKDEATATLLAGHPC